MAEYKRCLNHKDRSAEAQCHQCHKPACHECIVENEQGKFCSPECAARFREFKTRWKEPDLKKPFNLVGKLVGLAMLGVVFLGLAWVGHHLLGLEFLQPYDYLGQYMSKKEHAKPVEPAPANETGK